MTEGRELAVMEKGRNLLVVQETVYETIALVDVRIFYRDRDDVLKPTRKGISIRREEFGDFVDMLCEARHRLEEPA